VHSVVYLITHTNTSTCIYRVIQKDGLNAKRWTQFRTSMCYVNDLHNIWKRRS